MLDSFVELLAPSEQLEDLEVVLLREHWRACGLCGLPLLRAAVI